MRRETGAGGMSPWIMAVGQSETREQRCGWRWSSGGKEGIGIIAGSLPSGPRTAGRGTAAAAGRRPGPKMDPHLQC